MAASVQSLVVVARGRTSEGPGCRAGTTYLASVPLRRAEDAFVWLRSFDVVEAQGRPEPFLGHASCPYSAISAMIPRVKSSEPGVVAILCGGRGTRLQEHTDSIPKPLVEIGDQPIVGHVVDLYVGQGFGDFVLCTGYKGDLIDEYVRSREWPEGVTVACADTGLDTPTGGRVHRIRDRLPEGTFFVTYGDGLADIDLAELVVRHRSSRALATMTVVKPELQFGVAELDGDDRVAAFHEKPPLEHWINGGFFCFEPGVFDYLGDASVLEREPLEALAVAGELSAYRHTGFWECMDTYKDAVVLNDLWAAGAAPWRRVPRQPLR